MTDWMKLLPDSFPLSLVNLPGTHDSATQFISMPRWAQCQDTSIARQLDWGVRFLDLRLQRVSRRMKLVHASMDCRKGMDKHSEKLWLEEVLADCLRFLSSHPSEALVVSLKMDDGWGKNAFAETLFEQYISPSQEHWFLENRIPKLGEVRGKLVLLRRYPLPKKDRKAGNGHMGFNFSVWKDQGSGKATRPLPCTWEGRLQKEQSAWIQDRYGLRPPEKWEKAFFPLLQSPLVKPETVFLQFLSTAGGKDGPARNAEFLNARFEQTPLLPGTSYGWIILDFITPELAKKVIASNFSDNQSL